MEDDKKEKPVEKKPEPITIIIPQCCREGWESCKHVAQRQKKTKKNIGM